MYYDLSMTRKFEIITVYSEQAKLYKALFLAMRGDWPSPRTLVKAENGIM